MKKNYEQPLCELHHVKPMRILADSLEISTKTITTESDGGWAKEDIFGGSSNEPKPQSLWED